MYEHLIETFCVCVWVVLHTKQKVLELLSMFGNYFSQTQWLLAKQIRQIGIWINENKYKFARERDANSTIPDEIRAVIGIYIWLVLCDEVTLYLKICGLVMEVELNFLDVWYPSNDLNFWSDQSDLMTFALEMKER